MSQPRHSPIVMLALPQFKHSFGDLLSVRALITDFSRSLIEGTFESVMWFGRTSNDYRNFERTARAAYHFLEEGTKVRHKDIVQKYALVIDQIMPAWNNSGEALNEAIQIPETEADTRIRKYLEFYKVMYEGLLRVICAPVVYAFAVANKIKDKAFIPDDNGRIGLNTLKSMEKWLVYSENRLAIGLNNHIRNAYAHEHYKILDDAKVELWDPDPYRPNRSWGPEVWPLEELIKLCDQLWVNALGITCSLILYDINNRQIAAERGWVPSTKLPRLRREELKVTISTVAKELGFHMKEITILNNKLSITLSTESKGIDQDSNLYMGYKDHARLFKVRMWYEEKRVVDQLTGMLHRLIPYFETKTEVSIHVVSWDDSPIGVLITDLSTISGLQLMNINPETVESIRHIFKMDTVGDSVTYVEKKGDPRFVGTVPSIPKPEVINKLKKNPPKNKDKKVR